MIHGCSRRGETPAEAPADTYQALTEQLNPCRIFTVAMFALTTEHALVDDLRRGANDIMMCACLLRPGRLRVEVSRPAVR